MPDLPRGSSAEPTWYHTIWVTIGARMLVMTTTSSPLASLKVVGLNTLARVGGATSAAETDTSPARTRKSKRRRRMAASRKDCFKGSARWTDPAASSVGDTRAGG